ncbi:hypothetical protein ACFFWC_07340 [Plantactinospora siamensis]|uniref:Right handed beta helix domain-containing protein n=1 Tax=Plantactinospora siamensis TaxID=555372 RepID=A0ABV6NXA2_9ACTN
MIMAAALLTAGVGVAAATDRSGSVTVHTAGTVLDGRHMDGYIYIAADNVTIKNSVIRSDGDFAVRIGPGFTGAVIENTQIECAGFRTVGVGFGNYTADRVRLVNCPVGFRYGAAGPVTITNSSWNGRAVTVAGGAGAAIGSVAGATSRAGAGSSPGRAATVAGATTGLGAAPAGASGGSASPARAAATTTALPPRTFPTAATTGVPAGTILRKSGSLTLGTAGQVVTGLDISGCVTVTASNVTIRKSRIRCSSNYSIRTMSAVRNLVVEDVEINGMAKNDAAVCCGNYTLRRVDISNAIDGPRLGDNTVVEDSWIHHLSRVGASHNDTLQTTGSVNVAVRHNRLEAYNPITRDPMNACIMIGSTTAPLVADLLFQNNYCDGGNYSIGVRTDLTGRNIRFLANAFGHDCRYGIINRPSQAGIVWDRPSNLWADTRTVVVR